MICAQWEVNRIVYISSCIYLFVSLKFVGKIKIFFLIKDHSLCLSKTRRKVSGEMENCKQSRWVTLWRSRYNCQPWCRDPIWMTIMSWLLHCLLSFLSMCWANQRIAQLFVSLLAIWETWKNVPPSGFSLAHPQVSNPVWLYRLTEMVHLSLSPSASLSLCLSPLSVTLTLISF